MDYANEPTFKRAFRRVGWLGVPLGVVATLFAMISSDLIAWSGPIVAVAGGAMLPRPDRFAAIVLGAFLYWLMFNIPLGGADNPINGIAAYCAAGFSLGALLITAVVEIARRLHRQPS